MNGKKITKVKVIINNKSLAKLHGIKAGSTVSVDLHKGVPIDREWRNRFKDCEIDNCITIPVAKKEAVVTKK